MPRNPKQRKNTSGGKKFHKNYKHPKGKNNFKKPNNENDKFKKFKHIQRNQESEEALRRQKEVEFKSVKHLQVLESSSDEEEISPMDQLLESFQNTKKRTAIESSDSSDDEKVEDDTEEEEEEPVKDGESEDLENDGDNKKVEEESESEEESDSDDDLPEETILRPEESKQPQITGMFHSVLGIIYHTLTYSKCCIYPACRKHIKQSITLIFVLNLLICIDFCY